LLSLRREARIDRDAFERNVASFVAKHGDCVWDARADAYGHGLIALAPLALAVGAAAIRVSPSQEESVAHLKRSRIMTVDSVRPLLGAEAYGLAAETTAVMTLVGEVIAVKPTEAGAGVSYGYSYHTTNPTTLALVALGYADGVPRLASNTATVSVGSGQHPVVGRIAMDQFVVDCGDDVPELGADAVLFGDSAHGYPTAGQWAEVTSRSALQLTAGVGWRVKRSVS